MGACCVLSAHAEPEAPLDTAPMLWDALTRMAGWLELERVEVRGAGDLAPDWPIRRG